MADVEPEKGLVGAGRAAAAAARSEPATAEPEQLDLGLPAITQPDGSKFVPRPRGPGRPAGSSNVLTRRWRDYLLSRYPSPLEGITAIAALGVEDIKRSLGCSALEAMNVKIRCLETAVGYLYPKLQATLYHRTGESRDDPARLILANDDELELGPMFEDSPG